jgi:DNA-directed RNA polymerase subunit alpha
LHEYSTLPHLKEEIMEIIQRVKTIRLRALTDRPGRLRLEARGPGEIYASDIIAPADFEIVNPELHIATLDSSEGTLNMEFNVERGTGYVPAQQSVGYSIGTLPVDAIYSPVRKVNYSVEYTRVGQVTDYERLIIEVWTDRTISPLDAVHTAAKVLMDHSALLIGAGAVNSETNSPNNSDIPAVIYNVTVEKLELSSRTLNCLKRAGINKVGEVLERTAAELLKIRNFGDKSLDELRARLEENDLPVPDSLLGRSDAPEESESVAEDAGQATEVEGAEEEEAVTEFPKED